MKYIDIQFDKNRRNIIIKIQNFHKNYSKIFEINV